MHGRRTESTGSSWYRDLGWEAWPKEEKLLLRSERAGRIENDLLPAELLSMALGAAFLSGARKWTGDAVGERPFMAVKKSCASALAKITHINVSSQTVIARNATFITFSAEPASSLQGLMAASPFVPPG